MPRGGFLSLKYLRILQGVHIVYEQEFHVGANIIRGQNGSGKSTIADFIFYILGGEFDDWKDAASQCDEVHAEIETSRGCLTLMRRVAGRTEPISVFFGTMTDALENSKERWERFPIRRHAGHESFSQMMFRSMYIPEAKSEGSGNITMHQLLRLCYSDQRTPAPRLFRFEQFDTHAIREAVGDLICGISDYELYEIGLELRERERSLEKINVQLQVLQKAVPGSEGSNLPERIKTEIHALSNEFQTLKNEINRVEELVEQGEVKAYLSARKKEQLKVHKEREKISGLESSEKIIQFELSEIRDYVDFLGEMKERVGYAEATYETIGSIEFTHCPACGEELDMHTPRTHCVVCKSSVNTEKERARYNQIRLDLEIQARESRQLIEQKNSERLELHRQLRRLRQEHERSLSNFNIKYAGANTPRDAFLASRIKRLGQIEVETDFRQKSLEMAEQIAELVQARTELTTMIESLRSRERVVRDESKKRRRDALSLVSKLAAPLLRSDLDRQEEFASADKVEIDFPSDSISVDGLMNFAESSNVFLKNAAVLGLFLAAGRDEKFFHPRFVLIDNIEDKGMEPERSHLFQNILVEKVTELEIPCQLIYTTSMMNPELELDKYTVGPEYTSENRTLTLMN